MVWQVAERDGFVSDVQAMRRRVVENIPAREADRQLKLGSGGLRDVEFAVQLLQLVHGRTDPTLRDRATLSALAALTTRGYVGREDGEALTAAYSFLRTLEHRIQLQHLRRTHVVPSDQASLRRLGRSMGFVKDPDEVAGRGMGAPPPRGSPPPREALLPTAARGGRPGAGRRRAAHHRGGRPRLAALGFADPKAALRHLEALTSGVSRTAAIQRALLPAMLEWFADAPDPDAGLFGFRRISESLGSSHWYLKTLRDEGQVAERLARVLATSRYATDLIEREPEGVRMLGGDLTPLSSEAILTQMRATADRQDDPGEAVRSIRALRRRELFRIAVGELFGEIEVAEVGAALSRLTDATLEATLESPGRSVRAQRGIDEAPTRMAVVAMGRYGGFELSYGSDADVLFVHEPLDAQRRRRHGVRPGRGQRAPRPPDRARERPRTRGRRRPPPRGQAGSAGAHARVVRRLLRQVVEGLGGAGAAPRRRGGRRRGRARAVHRADRPPALPARRHQRRRRRRGTPDQGARRPRAAAPRRRPAHPPQARPRRARRHRVDRPAPPAPVRRRGARRCAARAP